MSDERKSELPECAAAGCTNKADPRFYIHASTGRGAPACDGHGNPGCRGDPCTCPKAKDTPPAREQSDHAKRLAEIEARAAAATKGPWTHEKAVHGHTEVHYAIRTAEKLPEHPHSERFLFWACGWLGDYNAGRPLSTYRDDPRIEADVLFATHAREDVPWLLAQLRAASDALNDAGVLAEVGSLAERIVFLHKDADAIGASAERAQSEIDAASAALTALGVPDNGRPLVERLRSREHRWVKDCGNALVTLCGDCGADPDDEDG